MLNPQTKIQKTVINLICDQNRFHPQNFNNEILLTRAKPIQQNYHSLFWIERPQLSFKCDSLNSNRELNLVISTLFQFALKKISVD